MKRRLINPGDRVHDESSGCDGVATKIHDDHIEVKFDAPGYVPPGAEGVVCYERLWRSHHSVRVL